MGMTFFAVFYPALNEMHRQFWQKRESWEGLEKPVKSVLNSVNEGIGLRHRLLCPLVLKKERID